MEAKVSKRNSVPICTSSADALRCAATQRPLRRLRRRGRSWGGSTERHVRGRLRGASRPRSVLEEGCDEGTFVAVLIVPTSAQSELNIREGAGWLQLCS